MLIEKSLKGWKEVEYEVVRDAADVRYHYSFPPPSPNIKDTKVEGEMADR